MPALVELLERTVELTALNEAWSSAREMQAGTLALLPGEAGIGKTPLVRAFCDGSRSRRCSGAAASLSSRAQFDTVAAAAEGCDALVATGVMPTGVWR